MKKKSVSQLAFLNLRVVILLALFTGSIVVALFAATVDGRTRRGETNPVGLGFDSTTAKSAQIKGRPGAPEGTGQWVWQKPLPQGNPLAAVSFTDPNNGTAVGEGGTILRTTNGGAHWTIQTSGYEGTGINFLGVSFTDANTGTAAGLNLGVGNAVVVRTTDGGNTWVTKYSNSATWITGVSFSDANTGTVIGVDFNLGAALILRTTDGGDTWTSQTGPLALYYGVFFTDANNGTIVGGGGTIVRTTDGGVNWIQQTSGTTGDLFGVSFTDANNGTAVGANFCSFLYRHRYRDRCGQFGGNRANDRWRKHLDRTSKWNAQLAPGSFLYRYK